MATGYQPHNFIRDCVAYTGTHDNDTIQGWFASADPVDTEWAREYFRLTKEEGYHWGMMRALWGSVADTAIVQAQDLLGLGSEAQNERAVHCGAELAVAGIAGSVHRRIGTEDTSDDGAV